MIVLISGGTGTLGTELTRQLLNREDIDTIRIFSRSESKQAEMQAKFNNKKLRFLIGDIRDIDRVRDALSGVDIVFHCAALKRVDKTHDVDEIEKTNIQGTRIMANIARRQGIKKFMMISSDKAVRPTNVYGSSKMHGEQKVLQMNAHSNNTRYAVCRYGNVLGSTGSLLQIWPKQVEQGKIFITDENMTRFWIRIEKAAEFVIRCMDGMSGGEIFIPKMKSFGIKRLADLLYPRTPQEIIGMRDAGEKLHEELITPLEVKHTKDHGDKYIVYGNHFGGISVESDFEYTSEKVPSFTDEEMLLQINGDK